MNLFESNSAKLLIAALLSLENDDECKAFLEDLMTTREILDISQRIEVAKLLCEDNSYSKIAERTGASMATITRVNRSFRYGSDGYKNVLSKLYGKEIK